MFVRIRRDVRLQATVALVLVSLLTGACAGDPEPATTNDSTPSPGEDTPESATPEGFVAQADAICTEIARAIAKNEKQYSAKTSAKESISIDEETGVLASERYEALAVLTPPEELASDFEGYLAKRKAVLKTFEASLEARREKDTRKAKKFQSRQNALIEQVNDLGRSIGLKACANTLPPSAEREVKDNLVRYFKKPDLATCKTLSTKSLLRSIGGLPKCVDRLLASKKVTIDEINGVEGVRADAELVADAYADTTILVGLIYEGGTYRINRYEPKE